MLTTRVARTSCRANSFGERQQLVIGNSLFSLAHIIKYMYQPGTDNVWSITIPTASATDLSSVGG